MALIGEAAYFASPMSGQGSCLALSARTCSLGTGRGLGSTLDGLRRITTGDRLLRPFVAANQRLGMQSAACMTQDSATAPAELSGQ